MLSPTEERAAIAAAKVARKESDERAAAEIAAAEAAASAREAPQGQLNAALNRTDQKVEELERWLRQIEFEIAERGRHIDKALTNIAPGVVPNVQELYGIFATYPAAEHCVAFHDEVSKRLTAARSAREAARAACLEYARANGLEDMLPADLK
jgi:hypothetical protein